MSKDKKATIHRAASSSLTSNFSLTSMELQKLLEHHLKQLNGGVPSSCTPPEPDLRSLVPLGGVHLEYRWVLCLSKIWVSPKRTWKTVWWQQHMLPKTFKNSRNDWAECTAASSCPAELQVDDRDHHRSFSHQIHFFSFILWPISLSDFSYVSNSVCVCPSLDGCVSVMPQASSRDINHINNGCKPFSFPVPAALPCMLAHWHPYMEHHITNYILSLV